MTLFKNIINLAKKGFMHSSGRSETQTKSQAVGKGYSWHPAVNHYKKAPASLNNNW